MQAVNWCAEMALGVPAIDEAHKAFLGELGKLADAGREQLVAGIASLIPLMECDFREEEAMMEKIAFPALASHRAQHTRALEGLKQAHAYVAGGDLEVGHETILQLRRWFLIHLSTMDLALAIGLEMAGQHLAPPPTVFLRAQLSRMLNGL
jgi:hemerythrin-like metal-binding protein